MEYSALNFRLKKLPFLRARERRFVSEKGRIKTSQQKAERKRGVEGRQGVTEWVNEMRDSVREI